MKYQRKTKPATWTKVHPKIAPSKAPKRIRESKAHASARRRYNARVKVWLTFPENKYCQVAKRIWKTEILADQVHHRFGRRGKLLMWEPGWTAVSGAGQAWIHSNIEVARRHQLYAPEGAWENYERAVAVLADDEGVHCRANRDGDCYWRRCPQIRDNEPVKSGRHCPLDIQLEDGE